MKPLKKVIALLVLLVGIFAFNKFEERSSKMTLNLDEIDVIAFLMQQEFECRPSSKLMFYVEADLVKKSRGSSTINANVYLLDRESGKYNLLANENIVIPTHKDMISLEYEIIKSNCNKTTLENGDKIVGSTISAPYCFGELLKYETVYNSYMRATNELLEIDRAY